MKGIRSLFRLGALAMVAVLLVVALTVPTAAASQTCKKDQMLEEVVILSVSPVESAAFSWDSSDLLFYGDGAAGTYATGQLEVQFNDISTAHRITHYDLIATPSDEPGTSDALGIEEVVTQINRPAEVGSLVTATLDLEPGTNYDIDVVAYYYSVKISPNQSNQDSLGATTYLSPPFLGGGVVDVMTDSDSSPSDDGVHYLVYKSDQELHTLRWLNPQTYGPFDHKWSEPGSADKDAKGADILCTDEDGDLVEDCYAELDVVKGVTHYRVTVTDEDGNTEYVDEIEVVPSLEIYEAEFNLNDGTYIFAVDAGYVDGNKFYALSDKAQVEFDIPDDYLKYNQDDDEIDALMDNIVSKVKGQEDDFDAYYGSVWDYNDYEDDGSDPRLAEVVPAEIDAGEPNPDNNNVPYTQPEEDARDDQIDAANLINRQNALIIYLNNLYN